MVLIYNGFKVEVEANSRTKKNSTYLFPDGPNVRLLARLAKLLSKSPVNTLAPSLEPLVVPVPPLGCIISPKSAAEPVVEATAINKISLKMSSNLRVL